MKINLRYQSLTISLMRKKFLRLIFYMLGGVILSSSFMGRIPGICNTLYRPQGILAVETFANLGVMYCVP